MPGPERTPSVSAQFKEVTANGWTDYVSSVALNAIHYEVFHRHIPDTNPPTWNTSIGLVSAVAGDGSVTLQWGTLQDQSPPLKFDLYYTKDAAFNLPGAVKVPSISPSFDSSSMRFSYTLDGLTNHSRYEFVVRASDASDPTGADFHPRGCSFPRA